MSTTTTNMLQLPAAVGVDGSDTLWIVQGGTDKYATVELLVQAASDVPLNAEFVLLSSNAFLPSSRVLEGTAGIVILTDNGAGSNVVISLDGPGVAELITESRIVTAAGNVTVADDDLSIFMEQTVPQAVDIILPLSEDKEGPVYIGDVNGVALANNFRVVVTGGVQTVGGLSEYLINANYMAMELRPVPGVGYVL